MEKPKARHVSLDISTITYFGDWIVNFEKTIQTLASTKTNELPKVKHSTVQNEKRNE